MMMPRFLSGRAVLGQVLVGISVVAWLLPDQLPQGTPLICGSCAPSVTRKTKGSVLVGELPSPTVPP